MADSSGVTSVFNAQDLLVRWHATVGHLAKLRNDLASLEQQRVRAYAEAWRGCGNVSVSERNKWAETDVAHLVVEIVRVKSEVDTKLDEIAWLKAAIHVVTSGG